MDVPLLAYPIMLGNRETFQLLLKGGINANAHGKV
jgi:hypothetical protein